MTEIAPYRRPSGRSEHSTDFFDEFGQIRWETVRNNLLLRHPQETRCFPGVGRSGAPSPLMGQEAPPGHSPENEGEKSPNGQTSPWLDARGPTRYRSGVDPVTPVPSSHHTRRRSPPQEPAPGLPSAPSPPPPPPPPP